MFTSRVSNSGKSLARFSAGAAVAGAGTLTAPRPAHNNGTLHTLSGGSRSGSSVGVHSSVSVVNSPTSSKEAASLNGSMAPRILEAIKGSPHRQTEALVLRQRQLDRQAAVQAERLRQQAAAGTTHCCTVCVSCTQRLRQQAAAGTPHCCDCTAVLHRAATPAGCCT